VAIICRSKDSAPPAGIRARFIFDPPPWKPRTVPARIVNSACFRLGLPSVIARSALRRWKPDLIHAHFGWRGWEMLPFAESTGAPLAVSFYGSDAWRLPSESPLWRRRFGELFQRGAWFIAEGPAMRQRLLELGAPADRVSVVHIGIDLDRIPFLPSVRPAAEPLRVLMFGRFVEKKGFPEGLRACAIAAAAGVKLRVSIAGDAGKDDPSGQAIRSELRALADAEPLRGIVSFTGFIPLTERFDLLSRHDVLLVPSRHAADGDAEGGAPVSLTEAMAAGLVPVGTAHCDIPMLIEDHVTGLLVPENDEPALAKALCKLAGADATTRRSIAERARAHVGTHFSSSQQVAQLRQLYSDLAADSTRAPAVP